MAPKHSHRRAQNYSTKQCCFIVLCVLCLVFCVCFAKLCLPLSSDLAMLITSSRNVPRLKMFRLRHVNLQKNDLSREENGWG